MIPIDSELPRTKAFLGNELTRVTPPPRWSSETASKFVCTQQQTLIDSNMSDSPPPPDSEESKRVEAEAKAKEEAEQAALPYKWTQTIKDVDVTISIPANYKGKDLDVKMTKNKLRVAIKGQDAILDVPLPLALHSPILTNPRATSPTPFFSTNPPGRSRPSPAAKKSPSTSTRSTRWSGGRTSSPPPPKST